jgi:hypothetical protein
VHAGLPADRRSHVLPQVRLSEKSGRFSISSLMRPLHRPDHFDLKPERRSFSMAMAFGSSSFGGVSGIAVGGMQVFSSR